MSGFARAQKRAALRQKYKKFSEAWGNEKRYQRYLELEDRPLPSGTVPLGRKPTFSMWLKAVENRKISEDVEKPPPTAADPKQVEVADAEWE